MPQSDTKGEKMVKIDGESLVISDVINVAVGREKVALSSSARPKINKSRKFVEKILAENRCVYGITTGVGELANTRLSPEQSEQMQENLIRSHSTSVGEPFSEEIVRGMMLLRANALSKGFSGARVDVIELLIEFLNNQVYPYIPCQGSVGASGDLSPLSHLALALIGEGECLENGSRVATKHVLQKKGIRPIRLQAKEGLALINGTQIMTSIGCLVVHEAELLLKNAQISAAMTLEALKGTDAAFDAKIHKVRPHAGQVRCASNMRRLVKDSKIIKAHRDCKKVQDAYTLRCIPQVLGALIDTVEFVKNTISIELNSANDNPLVFANEQEVISGGNFHGEPLAVAMDYIGIAIAEIGSMAERRTDRLVNPHVSGLPPFLSKDSGLNSGFMIAQYTAAALVSENKVLAHPASVDSIPTSAGQEDHVSMGPIAARHALQILRNVQNVIAIEMLCGAQGIDFWKEKPGRGTTAAHEVIRRHISHLGKDRAIYADIEEMCNMIKSGEVVERVEKAIGKLD